MKLRTKEPTYIGQWRESLWRESVIITTLQFRYAHDKHVIMQCCMLVFEYFAKLDPFRRTILGQIL